jgi:hypothetical protein
VKQLTREQAIQMHDLEGWKALTDVERFQFQLGQNRLCMPFSEFHRCAEVALKRPVWTHEFAGRDKLRKEFEAQGTSK